MLNLVCVRTGSKYGPEYVSRLFDMLLRNLTAYDGNVRCWCITDDPESLPAGVMPIEATLPGWWAKLNCFSPDMPWEEGDRIAYFDLDLCITGRLEDLVATKGIIQDWKWEGSYNSSVMIWDHGEHRQVWNNFHAPMMNLPDPIVPQHALPAGQINGGDQTHISHTSKWETFPPEWCVSYRDSATFWPPEGCKVVSFNGAIKPHEITEGWVPETWREGGLTSLPEMKGVNTSREAILDNVRENVKRDLPWFTGAFPHGKTIVLVCGGPSLKNSVQAIRDHQKRGARIMSVNNTLRFLVAHNIKPDCHVMLDARPENVEFLTDAPKGVQYFLASQCHPVLFDALKDHSVTLWHNAVDGGELEAIAEPYETDERPVVPVPGGGTVGLRCIWLAFFSGYRKLHIYGMDGSYAADAHHAYAQKLNDGEETLNVMMGGKAYKCARWMARQASEATSTFKEVTRHGLKLFVHGEGLIPDIYRTMRANQQAMTEAVK